MKNKLKKAVCLFGVFIASFMLTVTAFATVDVDFDFYIGKYIMVKNGTYYDGYVKVNDENDFVLFAYIDFDNMCYVSGKNGTGRIVAGKKGFETYFERVVKCAADGTLPANPGYVPDFKATGAVTKFIKTAYIVSDQSGYTYKKEK